MRGNARHLVELIEGRMHSNKCSTNPHQEPNIKNNLYYITFQFHSVKIIINEMRFLIFSILIYFVAGQAALLKALDVFKKNQWSVNKVLKSNQLQAKQRADGLQRMIMAQSKIIKELQVRNSQIITRSTRGYISELPKKLAISVLWVLDPQTV